MHRAGPEVQQILVTAGPCTDTGTAMSEDTTARVPKKRADEDRKAAPLKKLQETIRTESHKRKKQEEKSIKPGILPRRRRNGPAASDRPSGLAPGGRMRAGQASRCRTGRRAPDHGPGHPRRREKA